MLKTTLITLAIAYLAFVGILYIFQRHLIYFPGKTKPSLADWQAESYKEVSFKTKDGLSLSSWYHSAQTERPTLVYFHGNAGHMGMRASLMKGYINAGYGVMLLSYRGYGGNPGSPTEQGLYQDARAALDYLKSHGVPENCMILYGESLGTGVAVKMATELPVGAVILQAPYTRLSDVGAHHYFYLPVKWLAKDRFPSIELIHKLYMPVMIIQGEQDEVVPVKFGKALYAKASTPKKAIFIKNRGHNNLGGLSEKVIPFITEYAKCRQNK